MKIGGFDTDRRVLVIAEIGNNHEGNVDTALQLVRAAAEAGADAVKFQTFRTHQFVRRADAERFARLQSFELPPDAWQDLARRARDRGLLFLSTPLDLGSADLLRDLVDAFKIASGDLTFFPLIERVAAFRKPILFSTGLADLPSVERALHCAEKAGAGLGGPGEVAVLHCVSSYPTPPEEANLLSIPTLAERFHCTVGYSDHVPGIEAAVAAVALGARVLEKHFTLDKNYSSFRDHSLSADPEDLKALVRRVREVERMRGRPGKEALPSEAGSVSAFRRSIVAGRDLSAGHALAWEDLAWLRPAGGMNPGEEGQLLGRRLVRDVSVGDGLSLADVQ